MTIKGSYEMLDDNIVPSTTEHGVSQPQIGTIHFQKRRNRHG